MHPATQRAMLEAALDAERSQMPLATGGDVTLAGPGINITHFARG
jgi:hypothetical protein